MRLLNRLTSPRYCSLAGVRLPPGGTSRELDCFLKPYREILDKSKGFEVILSGEDLDLLAELCSRFLAPAVKEGMDLGKFAGLEGLEKYLSDPDGTLAIAEQAKAVRDGVRRIREEARRAKMEKEARIALESNIIGPDGNPIPRADMAARESSEPLKAERHPEMSTDLRSIMENNLAVMTTASGQPIDKTDTGTVRTMEGGK